MYETELKDIFYCKDNNLIVKKQSIFNNYNKLFFTFECIFFSIQPLQNYSQWCRTSWLCGFGYLRFRLKINAQLHLVLTFFPGWFPAFWKFMSWVSPPFYSTHSLYFYFFERKSINWIFMKLLSYLEKKPHSWDSNWFKYVSICEVAL
jgi:hypothetical protein